MYFTILINLIGVISVNGTNAMYPSYSNSAKYEFHEKNNGSSYVDVDDNLFVSDIDIDVTGNIYFNSTNDYYLTDIIFDITITHYQLLTDGTYSEISDFNVYKSIGSKKIDQNNIDNVGTFDLRLEYSDVIDYQFYNPLGLVNNEQYLTGSTALPGNESLYETDYRFAFSFSGGFKDNVITYINRSLNPTNSYNSGFNDGYQEGNASGYQTGLNDGYQEGYTTGYIEAGNQSAVATSIFTGIINIALIPINFFLAIFNFEVFGINISSFVAGLLTIAVVVIIIRIILGNMPNGADKGGGKK